jgi:hypothetical protein
MSPAASPAAGPVLWSCCTPVTHQTHGAAAAIPSWTSNPPSLPTLPGPSLLLAKSLQPRQPWPWRRPKSCQPPDPRQVAPWPSTRSCCSVSAAGFCPCSRDRLEQRSHVFGYIGATRPVCQSISPFLTILWDFHSDSQESDFLFTPYPSINLSSADLPSFLHSFQCCSFFLCNFLFRLLSFGIRSQGLDPLI